MLHLVITLAERLTEVEVETLGEKKAHEEAKPKVDTLAANVTEWEVNTFGYLLSVVKANAYSRH